MHNRYAASYTGRIRQIQGASIVLTARVNETTATSPPVRGGGILAVDLRRVMIAVIERVLEQFGLAGFATGVPKRSASVVVDGTALDTGHRGRGIGRYVGGLLDGFGEIFEGWSNPNWPTTARNPEECDALATLRLGGRLQQWFGLDDDDVAGGVDGASTLPTWRIRRPPVRHFHRWLINESALDRELKAGGAELYHGTEPWAIPISPEFKTVVTCHDVIPLLFPDHYLGLDHFQWSLYYRTLRRQRRWQACDRIIAISEATKRTVVEHLDVDPSRITVVPNGIDHDAFSPVEDEATLRGVCTEYGLSRPFALYLGGYDYRKNVDTLVRAVPHLPDETSLVLAGGMWPDEQHELERLVDRLGVEDSVEFVGYVADSDLQAMYSAAEVFLYPSLAEGFGLQLLEAMATGCPVVASFATSLPEVVGDAGILVNPSDPRDVGRAAARVLENEEVKRELEVKGRKRAAEFSWRRTAEQTLEVYESVLSDGSTGGRP